MMGNAADARGAKPYKGVHSFEVEDGDLFFGRVHETELVLAKILSSRLTLLHAPSGAGKTSLLNARIIPELEARGWYPVRARPLENPIASVRNETLAYLLPPPSTEADAIVRACDALSPGRAAETTIDELLARYDDVAVASPYRRRLVQPLAVGTDDSVAVSLRAARVTPYFCRLLRSSIETPAFDHQLKTYLASGGPHAADVTGGTIAEDLVSRLRDPETDRRYRILVGRVDSPLPTLEAFFRNVIETYGRAMPRFGVVLVLDQFEELFTRFIDPGAGMGVPSDNQPDWRLRWRFFEELAQLYAARMTQDGDDSVLPIRVVISIRDEFVAQLDPVRQFAGGLEESGHHLGLLSTDEAEHAIREPARKFGYDYASDCLDQLLCELQKEERWVEPIHLQIVCERLWLAFGTSIASPDAAEPKGRISRDALRDLGGAEGILASFFKEFVCSLPEKDQLEVMDVLEPLLTLRGTRSLKEESDLVEVSFRDPGRRRRLLRALQSAGIVRIERRLDANFVSITHDFLAKSILEESGRVIREHPEFQRLREALRTLRYEVEGASDDGTRSHLTREDVSTLHEFRDDVVWSEHAVEQMLRASLEHGLDDAAVAEWCARFAHLPDVAEGRTLLETLRTTPDAARRLGWQELRALEQVRDLAAELLPATTLGMILERELCVAGPDDEGAIAFWTRRLRDRGA